MSVATRLTMRSLLASLLVLAACGVPPTPFGSGSDSGSGSGSGSSAYVPLITNSWSLPASTEEYLCVRQTVQSDMYIKAIEPIAPVGTHHSVLEAGSATGPDGTTLCSSEFVNPSLFASGVGTGPLELPDGVAIHLVAGEQLLLNLHLFNSTDDAMTGTSGISIIPTDAADVQQEAGAVLAGKTEGLVVVPGASTQTGTCTTGAGSTIFAAAPHMHLLGTHLTATYTPPGGGTATTLIDEDYSFDAQNYLPQSPMIQTQAGGKLTVVCSYFNPTGAPVYFGESTTDEMCFSMTLEYPPPAQPECTT
jgi:hypothetical protein